MELVTICSLISQIQYEDADGRTLPVTTILRQQQFCKQHVSPGMRNIRHLLYTNTQVFTLFEESWDKWRDACGTFVWTLSPPIKVASPYQRNSTPPPFPEITEWAPDKRQSTVLSSYLFFPFQWPCEQFDCTTQWKRVAGRAVHLVLI